MQTKLINKQGTVWTFSSVETAKPFIKKDRFRNYETEIKNRKKIRIYDDRKIIKEQL